MRRNRIYRPLAILCAVIMTTVLPVTASAAVQYMPDVTAEMSRPSYWSDKMEAPDTVLVNQEEIDAINDAILHGEGTYMNDLANWPEETFDGAAYAQTLKKAGLSDAKYFYDDCGAKFDRDGNTLSDWDKALEQKYQPMIDNCVDPLATESMPIQYAICTTRTCVVTLPSDERILDDPDDPDFDYQYQTMVRVGEPLIVKGVSADRRFYHVFTSCVSGWISVEDVAICADKAQWLAAWQFDPSETLVVYDDKITTPASNVAPETANRKLPMGTCLKLAKESEWSGLVSNRSAYNNHVVWMPVRQEDGSYLSKLALIPESRKVSEGFLPLTSANLARVALNQLGDAYGWGGMLDSDDCSGYVRDVYKCFGLELARNTNWQAAQPVRKFDLTNLSSTEKTELIKALPVGAVLIFNGHEMFYLGHEGDKLYIISSVSSAMVDGVRTRVRGGVINTLDIQRPKGTTWLDNLHTAEIPYYNPDTIDLSSAVVTGLKDVTYTGKAITPAPTVTLNGAELQEHAHYTLSVANNKKVGTATVTIEGVGNYAGTIEKTFQIKAISNLSKATVTGIKDVTYTGKAITPKPTVKANGKTLKKDTDYTVMYSKNKAVGTATVTIKGKGGYIGTAKKTFRIQPPGTSISKMTRAKKAFTVKWKKQKTQTTGYQIQYSTAKSFPSGSKTITLKNNQTVSKKIAKLKAKKTYYVRVRTYKVVDGKKYYSSWSKAKTVKTK